MNLQSLLTDLGLSMLIDNLTRIRFTCSKCSSIVEIPIDRPLDVKFDCPLGCSEFIGVEYNRLGQIINKLKQVKSFQIELR